MIESAPPRELLPMSLGDVLDEAFDLYKRNFPLIAGISAIIHVPMSILIQVLMYMVQSNAFSAPANGSDEPNFAWAFTLGGIVLAICVSYAVLYVVETGAICIATAERYLDRPTTISAVYRKLLGMFGQLLLTWILIAIFLMVIGVLIMFGVSMIAGMIAMIAAPGGNPDPTMSVVLVFVVFGLPMIAMAAAYALLGAFVTQAVTLEKSSLINAITRNFHLVQRGFWRVVGGTILIAILFAALTLALQASVIWVIELTVYSWLKTGPLIQNIVEGVWGGVLTVILQPFLTIAATILYYDQRVRRDGYDLAMITDRLPQPIPEPAA